MRIGMCADLHGATPKIPIDIDLLLIAGDFVPSDIHPRDYFGHMKWLGNRFRKWLETAECPIIACLGNHEIIFEKRPEMIPQFPMTWKVEGLVEYKGIRIWLQSHTPRFYDWAYNLDEEDLAIRWNNTPEDIDIVVTHGPPKGFCDWTSRDGRQGSISLTDYICRAKPDLVVCGHLHSNYGVEYCGDTAIINCSICDESYQAKRQIIVVEYQKGEALKVLNI